ncbi:MAG TPA: alpha/beta hydrolase [Acidimicrobiia bacterium]|nr:alpha/beta hydrolase [Acidimicrobiia bacterium]
MVAAVLILALFATVMQAIAERRDAAAYPPPGEHVELPDGRRLHLQIAGEQHDGPTVIFEAGAGAHSDLWAWIQPAVAEHATAVSYDRAGLGWSDRSDNGPGADAIVGDLRDALAARGLAGPYVLVGHSLGAHYVRAFADTHPEDVVGMVLVDPSHEDQSVITGAPKDMGMMFTVLRVAARLGIPRFYNPMVTDVHALPEPQRSRALSHLASTGTVRQFVAEMRAIDEIGAQLPTESGALGDLPLRILIATESANPGLQQVIAAWAELKKDMTVLSESGEAIVFDQANHQSIVTEEEHATSVAEVILDVLE